MTEDEILCVQDTVENEGFDYAFRSYSSFGGIKDEEFHRLRKAYIKAAQDLLEYIELE